MSTDLEKRLLAGRAYRIFHDELQGHLEATRQLFTSSDGWNEAVLRAASDRFHTIRGGAGFFGLKEISEMAGLLEVRLKGKTPAELALEIDELRVIDSNLRQAAAVAPMPVGEPPTV